MLRFTKVIGLFFSFLLGASATSTDPVERGSYSRGASESETRETEENETRGRSLEKEEESGEEKEDVFLGAEAKAGSSTVDRRHRLSYEEFARGYLYPGKPVIVTGMLAEWTAMRRWTPEFFAQEFGSLKFAIGNLEYGQKGYVRNQTAEYKMSDFIKLVRESSADRPAPYFRNKVLAEMFPSLMADIQPLPEYFEPNWLKDNFLVKRVGEVLNRGAKFELYIGGAGAKFPVLHWDGSGTHAFLMQIYGRKEYVVYGPEQDDFVYPNPDKPNLSLIADVDDADLKRFPEFARARATRFYLEPGELLFVPARWWHTARILSPSITISINILNQSNWHELVRWVSMRQKNPLAAAVSRIYLAGGGAWRSRRDRLWTERLRA